MKRAAAKNAAPTQKLPETGSDMSGAIGAATLLMLAGGAVVLGRSRARHAVK
ncbi:LPXTG cell wall anchor domain-containing protein [Actinotignum sp. GS-2025b]|uniref:LPXTG cell wall anchor domain-containing protein n=1 Tax=Actinotignum sp. GS-2025b TaxID=3427275 RepID=UPI003F45C001